MSVSSVFEDILRSRGELTPSVVVEEATPLTHPLHPFFNWDDAKAAHEHRLSQARELIRSVKVTRLVDKGLETEHTVQVRAWISVYDSTGEESAVGRYVPVETAVSDDLLRDATLRKMRQDWLELKSKYAAFAEFARMIRDEIDAVDASVIEKADDTL